MPETNLAGTKLSMTDAGLSSHDLNILSFLYPALPTEAVTAAAEYKG